MNSVGNTTEKVSYVAGERTTLAPYSLECVPCLDTEFKSNLFKYVAVASRMNMPKLNMPKLRMPKHFTNAPKGGLNHGVSVSHFRP